MAVTGTRTVREICTRALRRAGIAPVDQPAEAEDMAEAVELLDDMLKSWQTAPWMWTSTTGSLTLTTAVSYTLDPVRPLRIVNARLKRSGIETPMVAMTATEYDELPDKTVTGLPTQFFYDRQREAAKLYIWPGLATASGETIEYRYERELEDIASESDTIDVPAEWYRAVWLNLAAELALTYNRPNAGEIMAMAIRAKQDAAAGAMLEPVIFEPGY